MYKEKTMSHRFDKFLFKSDVLVWVSDTTNEGTVVIKKVKRKNFHSQAGTGTFVLTTDCWPNTNTIPLTTQSKVRLSSLSAHLCEVYFPYWALQ